MSGHIFDNNVLKNFLLTERFDIVESVCEGQLYISQEIKRELDKTKRYFSRKAIEEATAPYLHLVSAAQKANATLDKSRTAPLNIFGKGDESELSIWTCLTDRDLIDPGEVECLALAIERDFVIYSDDLGLKREIDRINV